MNPADSLTDFRHQHEEGVLACVLSYPEMLAKVTQLIDPHDFMDPDVRRIYERVVLIWDADRDIDTRNLTVELQKAGLINRDILVWINKIVSEGSSGPNAEYHAMEIARLAAHRRIVEEANRILTTRFSLDADPNRMIAEFEAATNRLVAVRNAEFVSVAEANRMFVANSKALKSTKSLPGIETGFKPIDIVCGGLRPGSLTLIGANTFSGKTAFSYQMAYRMAKAGKSVWFVSLEMTVLELHDRLASSITGIPLKRVSRNNIEDDELSEIEKLTPSLEKCNLVITDGHHESLKTIRAKGKLLKATGLDVMFIDYLQLMHSPIRGDRHLQVKAISRGLKLIAKELHIAIVALSQLNASSEGKEPKSDDWGECKTIIDDASVAMLIWRPNGKDSSRYVVKVVKGRNTGGTGQVELEFIGEVMRFQEPATQNAMLV